MKNLIILLLLSVQGYAQQIITESHVTIEIRNPHALTAPHISIGIPNAPVINEVMYWDANLSHWRDSMKVDAEIQLWWDFHRNFNRWEQDSPEYRKLIIDICKENHWINKDYYERTRTINNQ